MEPDAIEKWLDAACDDGFDPAAHGWLDEDDSPAGPALRDDELRAAHSTLTVPRPPRDFQAVVKALHRRTTSKVLSTIRGRSSFSTRGPWPSLPSVSNQPIRHGSRVR